MVVLAGITAYWFHVAGQLRKGIDAFAEQRRAQGWTVDLPPPGLEGFPRAVTARLPRVGLSSPAGLSWRGEDVTITIPLSDPLAPIVSLAGMHRLQLGPWSGVVSAGLADAHLRLDANGRPRRLDLAATTLVLEQPGLAPLTLNAASLGVERPPPRVPDHQNPSLTLALGLRGLVLPDMPGLLLGRRIEVFQMEGRLMGTLPDGPLPAALAVWSANGGTFELERLALDWAPLSIEADGTFALDPRMQPLLATTSRVRGWAEMVARLVQAGLVEPGMASAAELMMSILARPDAQGRSTLTIPVSVQDGILTAGQIRLLRVPPLSLPSLLSGDRPS